MSGWEFTPTDTSDVPSLAQTTGRGIPPTLVEFLLARIAEDEHWAKLADGVTDKVEDDWQDVTQPITHAMTQARPQEQWVKKYGYAFEHIARHDPARVLAECEAKRRIVEEHKPDAGGEACWTCADWTDFDHGVAGVDYPCSTLRALAIVYADHPDYDESWRP